MIIQIPELENMVAGSKKVLTNLTYGIKSSIYDPYPRGYIEVTADRIMPDALNLLPGNNVNMLYYLMDDSLAAENKTLKDLKDSDYEKFPTLGINGIETTGGMASGVVHRIELKHVSGFSQASDIKKCYLDKRGDEIIKDVIDSNAYFSSLEQNLLTTDNSNTIYRSLGELDVDFIQQAVNPNYLIDNGCPVFFIGLDGKINYTSLNALSKNADNVQGYLQLGGAPSQGASSTWVDDMISSNVVKDGATLTTKGNWKIYTGGEAAMVALRSAVYYTDFDNPFSTTISKLTYGPARKEKTLLPINKYFGTLLNTTQAIAVPNRPAYALDFEVKNLIGDAIEKFITIEASGVTLKYNKDDKPVVCGDQLFVLTPYEYSCYNGIYTIIGMEYSVSAATGVQANLTLARSHLDTQFVSMIDQHKDSSEFIYKYAPSVRKALLWDGK